MIETDFIVNNLGQVWHEKKMCWTYGTIREDGYMKFKNKYVHRILQ